MGICRTAHCALLVGFVIARGSACVAGERAEPLKELRSVEIGSTHETLTSGYPEQQAVYVRAILRPNDGNVWSGELAHQSKFDDHGLFYAIGNTHTFSPDWYGSLTVGSSSGGFFLPRFRADAFLNRKWGRARQLVTSLGLGYYEARDSHRDHSLSLGAVYYFPLGWIAEGGVRWNRSSPGSITARSQFIALTQGRDRHQFVTLRLAAGREAYQLIGPATPLVDFASREVSLTWRRWMGADWGFHLTGTYYANPSYERKGVSGGIFRSF